MSSKLYSLLAKVQETLKAPKNQYNSFGKYKYRSCEDILQAARPLCNGNGLVLTITDTIELIGNRYYVKATAAVIDTETGDKQEVSAYARECETKKGMDDSQLTGACSSYARKYALCGLFAIDDNKDADSVDTASYPQNVQNGAQQTKKQGAAKDTKAKEKAPEWTEKGLLDNLNKVIKEQGMESSDVTLMIQQHYGKGKWNDLTQAEKIELGTKPLDIWDAVMKKLGGENDI